MRDSICTQFQSRQSIEIIPLLWYSHSADVSKSVTLIQKVCLLPNAVAL